MPMGKPRHKTQYINTITRRLFKKFTSKVLNYSTPYIIYALKILFMKSLAMMYIFYTPVEYITTIVTLDAIQVRFSHVFKVKV